jgi:hypothetical protein
VSIGDIGATLLEPLEELTDVAAQAVAALGSGVVWTGEQIEKFAMLVGVLDAKLEELQAAARGDDDDKAAPPAAS